MSDDDIDEEEDGDDGEGAEDVEGGGEGPRLSAKKLVLFIGVPLILIIGGLVGAYFLGLLDPLLGDIAATEEGAESENLENSVFFDLPEMLVNLNTGGKHTSYLKIRISLEVADPLMLEQMEILQPRMVDRLQVFLRELRLEDLDGSSGLVRLKEEMLLRVNSAVKPLKVNDVLFKDMLVQ
ncbi:MAG: flagellar basal body-associated FliL family protein [Alphaproteobacteria bacterium]|mgnify:CR=1 FL=1|jgi:flagellar FliL protein|nr:flagellar basal body-associated FliL family protein [Alphaproteobacteria bacterium]MDP6623077.1 flagellar basal body-associated FliL family protein [Alphaproteobacteria bacterium]|tara:strand:- start:4131 stop:4673 length:543 start_codon:yes stop_codon:yes gene_type:complete